MLEIISNFIHNRTIFYLILIRDCRVEFFCNLLKGINKNYFINILIEQLKQQVFKGQAIDSTLKTTTYLDI